MTLVVDIRCPACGRARPVRKVTIGRYRCDDCGCEFSVEDATP